MSCETINLTFSENECLTEGVVILITMPQIYITVSCSPLGVMSLRVPSLTVKFSRSKEFVSLLRESLQDVYLGIFTRFLAE